MSYSIKIDKREQKIITWLTDNNIEFKTELLNTGDIQIYNDTNIIYNIERKTIQDMLSSIKDGRYKEQKVRLLSTIANQECNNIFYILEGQTNTLTDKEKNVLYGSWISCQFRDNINIIKTSNIQETCEFILKLLNRINLKPTDFIKYNDTTNIKTVDINYLKTIKTKKKNNITPNIAQILMLATIPNISNLIAEKVLTKYKTLHKLFKCYELCYDESERELLLANIKINDKRKLGNIASKNIYNYLFKNDV